MKWREVSVKTDSEAVEAVSEILRDCGAGGVVIEDPDMINKQITANAWDAFEFSEELLNRDFIRVTAYFPCDRMLENRINQIQRRLADLNRTYLPNSIKGFSYADVREEDWANAWKAYYKPVRIGQRIIIKPTWENWEPGPGELVVELDPGMAFGTGTHPTTVMCIKFLEKIIKGGEIVFDIGTGSGILAITAAKLGAGKVRAVDIDKVAVESAKANVILNQVADTVTVSSGSLLSGIKGQADIVISNITADVIRKMCPAAARALKRGGKFMTSGIIALKAGEVLDAVKKAGFEIAELTREGEWVSFIAVNES